MIIKFKEKISFLIESFNQVKLKMIRNNVVFVIINQLKVCQLDFILVSRLLVSLW